MKLMELFSGIGGFALGLQQAGYELEKHYFSEIDKHAIANYKYNFKNAEYIGSVTDVRGERGQADIITFGSPCQDFSLAGKRKGMDGERSSLITEAIRLVDEIKPSVFIWENVKGTFSSNDGADFWAILNAFANIGGYRLEWQLLNTSWFLPQNRERIYLIGHLDGRSRPGIFPIQENDVLVSETFGKKRDRTKIANTLSSSEYKLNCETNYVIPVLTPDRKEKRQNGRRFKENGDPSFTLSCQDRHGIAIKKNYIQWDESGKGYTSQQDRAFYEDGNMGTIPSSRTENKVNVLLNDFQIRRLTEIECERLQGFPDNEIFTIFEEWKHIKNGHTCMTNVSAEKSKVKEQEPVGSVEKIKLKSNVKYVVKSLNQKSLQIKKPALKNVHISFEEGRVQIHNQKKSFLNANFAETKNLFHPHIQIEDFVLLLVRIMQIQEKEILIGVAELHQKELRLILQRNLKELENLFGKEITQPVKNAENDLIILKKLLKYTTSYHLNGSQGEQILKTSYYFAILVIIGFIPKKIKIQNLSELSLSLNFGWTKFGNYDGEIKEISKTQRYKMCGNAVTVNVVQEIGNRLRNVL